ncbi:MAG: T9SS type A sorting domain-containing protein [bacterium]|nr:T9SS type A sorting domain-containing protein [bacterium]
MAWFGRQLLYAQGGVLRVLDFADPASPQLRSQTTLLAQPDDLRLDGSRLLLRYRPEWAETHVPQFQIGYVDPQGTVELQAPIITSFNFQDVTLCGETAYVDDGSYLHAYDLTDPANPRHVGLGPRGEGSLDCAGDYIGSGTVIVPRDCRDLKPPRPVRIEVRPTLKPGDPSGYTGPALIPVAVLGDGLFDPSTLVEASLRFGPLEAAPVPGPGAARAKQARTPRGDGAGEPLEALFWFPLDATGIGADAAPLRLTGRTMSGEEVMGTALAHAMPAPGPTPDIAIEAAPNPFNPSTTLRFSLPSGGPVKLTVRNLRGESVRTLLDEVRTAGDQAVVWDGLDDRGGRVASGVYLVSVEAGGKRATSRIALLK